MTLAGGYLYTAGMSDKQTFVFAIDLDGKQVWKKPNGGSWETTMRHATAYTGSRSTPTYDDGVVYHLGDLGQLSAFEHETGKSIWSLELGDLFDAEIPKYGYTESVLVDGDRLYCCPGGKKGFLACLNKKTGERLWASTGVPGTAGFSSLIVGKFSGRRQLIGMSSSCVFGADMESGKLLWTVDYENQRSNNATDPICHESHVFASSGYGKGSILIKLTTSGKKIVPETVWQTKTMDNHHGGVLLHEGHLYGSGHKSRGWFCLDLLTGKPRWNGWGKGSLLYADGMLYCLEEEGTMKLVKATPDRYALVSSFKVPRGGKGLYWAHPIVCGGRLYVRHGDKLFAYDVRAK
jgi:outer membrane protein assembly factor BamB